MKLIFTAFFIFLTLQPPCNELHKLRKLFQAEVNEKQLLNMITICEKSTCEKTTPYHAAAIMQRAEFEWSPIKKIKSFTMGKSMLENFILKSPQNIEARYIRWLTQKMAPSFLNYNQNLAEDYDYILLNIKKRGIDIEYQKTILAHLKTIK